MNLTSDAVIRFEPDGYDLNRPWVMGRHVAGNGFLRAAVAGRSEGPLHCYTAQRGSVEAFAKLVGEMDSSAQVAWIEGEQVERIGATRGVLYVPDPMLTPYARTRLRVGVGAHSICGVTHTIASAGTMQQVAELASEAVMPWDAVICTSTAALETIERVLEAQEAFLRWRLGQDIRHPRPQLPVIPLGVQCDDFAFQSGEREEARRSIGLADDEVAALYVGRLIFSGKAHPLPLYRGLQAVMERTGRKLVLIQCGRSVNETITEAFAQGAMAFAPDVRIIDVDSRDDAKRRAAWAAGDIFISLADGIQETFGLTPVEAMAAGLPVVVSDWNGYRDTVRDGVDGFRISTRAPEASVAGATYALRQEVGVLDYESYCWAAAAATSVNQGEFIDRVSTLVLQPELRRQMGAAGRERARSMFDWRHIFGRYQALWGDLNARRQSAAVSPVDRAWMDLAPRVAAQGLDPFEAFAHYPSRHIRPETMVSLSSGATRELFNDLLAHPLFYKVDAPRPVVLEMWAELERGPRTVLQLASTANVSPHWAAIVAAVLAKMTLVELS